MEYLRFPLHYVAVTQSYHQGKCIDFGWNQNQDGNTPDIYAVGSGVVTYAGVETGSGNVVYQKLDNGMIINYAHLSQINVKKGQKLKMSDVIGKMGHSGNATANHLHISIWSSMDAYNKAVKEIKTKGLLSDTDPFDVLYFYPNIMTTNASTPKNFNIKYYEEDKNPVKSVNTDILNFREEASRESHAIGQLYKETPVTIVKDDGAEFVKVIVTGYVSKEYLK